MKSGQVEAAAQLVAAAQPGDEDEKHFWDWLRGELQEATSRSYAGLRRSAA